MKAAELGSLSKAAHEMGYSIPALIKQINGIENQVGMKVFDRSNKGVQLTPGGRVLVQEAHEIIEKSRLAVRRAKRVQAQAESRVRLGVSIVQSVQRILELCRALYLKGTDLSIQFVPVVDMYETYRRVLANLGEDVDVIASAPLRREDERCCNRVVLEWSPLCLAVPIGDELATRDVVSLPELAGRRVRIPRVGRLGNDPLSAACVEIEEKVPDAEFVAFSYYEVTSFDECAQSGDIMLSSKIWSGANPLLTTVGISWDRKIPYCLYYPKEPRPAVAKFVQEMQALVAAGH